MSSCLWGHPVARASSECPALKPATLVAHPSPQQGPTHLRVLATTPRPNSVAAYRKVIRRFLRYLHAAFPKVQTLSQLHRDPHLLAWLRSLCDQDRPLCNQSRLNYLSGFAGCSGTWFTTAIAFGQPAMEVFVLNLTDRPEASPSEKSSNNL